MKTSRYLTMASCIVFVTAVGGVLIDRSSAITIGERAAMADSLVDSIGVNTHLHYTDRVYYSQWNSYVKQRLIDSGIRHIRDGAYTVNDFYYGRLQELGQAGITADLITSINTSHGTATDWSKLGQMQAWSGGMIDRFEGANEPDNQNVSDWVAQTRAAQQNLWNTVKGSPALGGVRVIGPSITWTGNIDAVGDLSSFVDSGNWHPYPGGDMPSDNGLDSNFPKYHQPVGNKPMSATETGYHNAINQSSSAGHKPASEAAAATYYPRLAFEYFNRGIDRFYGYELIDEGANTNHDEAEQNFGLLHNDGTPKPAYMALKNTIGLLSDKGPAFSTGSLNFVMTGSTNMTHHTLLQKRDGSYWLAIWQEVKVWDQINRQPLSTANVPLTLTFPAAKNFQTFVPNSGVTALANSSGTSITFSSTPQLTLVKISEPTTAANTSIAANQKTSATSSNNPSSSTMPKNDPNQPPTGGTTTNSTTAINGTDTVGPSSGKTLSSKASQLQQKRVRNKKIQTTALVSASSLAAAIFIITIIFSAVLHRHIFGPGWLRWFLHPRLRSH